MSDILLSIITIAYNDLPGIQFTQRHIDYNLQQVEQLIIDGGSTDETVTYLQTQPAVKWSSEADKGLYDAMNKGLRKAKGTYVIFMNSGDGFYDKNTLSALLEMLAEQQPDVLYGKTMLRDINGRDLGLRSEITTRTLPQTLNWHKLISGLLVCHQSFIIKRELATEYIMNNLSADYDWIINGLKKSDVIVNADMIIAHYLVGGISNQKRFESLMDRWKIMASHYGVGQTILAHINILIRFIPHTLGGKRRTKV